MRKQIEITLDTAARVGILREGMDAGVLGQRIQAHFDATALHWSAGYLDDESFRAAALFDVSLTGIAVYRGPEVDRFREILKRNQAGAKLHGLGRGEERVARGKT